MKFLLTGDIHMSNRLPYAKPSSHGRTDRLDDQIKLWKFIHHLANKYDVDGVFVLGDLFDKSLVDAVTLTHTVSAMVATDKKIYVLPGNHDASSARGGRFTVEALGAMEHDLIATINNECIHGVAEAGLKRPVTFWAMGFATIEENRRTLEQFRLGMSSEHFNVLLMHNSILGANHLGWTCDDGLEADEVCDGFDYVLSGHFHDAQQFGDCGRYLGSPMHHSFADVGREAGIWIMEFDGEGVDEEFIELPLPRFHQADWFEDDPKDFGHRPGDFLRYQVHVTHADWKSMQPTINEILEMARKEHGLVADAKHKPIYHHKARLMESGDESQPTMAEAVSRYVDKSDVVKGSLDIKKLKRIGREALGAAK